MRAAITWAFLLAMGAPAGAATTCVAASKLTSSAADGIIVTKFTPGQMNFLRGFVAGAAPTWKTASINADGAILIEHRGDKGGVVMLLRGPLACNPAAAAPELIAMLKGAKTGPTNEDGSEI